MNTLGVLGALAWHGFALFGFGRFALRRTNLQFWAASDALHEAYGAWAPLEAGLFDYNRLQNR